MPTRRSSRAALATVLVTPDPTFRGISPVLQTEAVRVLRAGGAAVHWAPRRLATLRGDVVEVQLHTGSRRFGADFDVAAELAAAAAAELGVLPEDICIVDGKVIVYHPTITVGVVVLDADGTRADATAAPVLVQLAIECGPTGNADTVALTTVRYAARKIARTIFGIPGPEAGAAVRLHVGDGAAASLGRGFWKLGGRDQDAVLAAAGIVNGAVLGVNATKRGCFRRRAKLKSVGGGGGEARCHGKSSSQCQ